MPTSNAVQGEARVRFLREQSEAGNGDASQTSNTSKNENLPTFTLKLTDIYSLEITKANRNSYTVVIVEWQDIEAGKVKSIKVGSGKAAEEAVKEVAALGGSGGIISIDKFGKTGFAWTKDKLGMYHGEARLGAKPVVYWPLGEK